MHVWICLRSEHYGTYTAVFREGDELIDTSPVGIKGVVTEQTKFISECKDPGNGGYGRLQGVTRAGPKPKAKPKPKSTTHQTRLQHRREARNIAFGFLPLHDPDPLPLGDRPEGGAGADGVVNAALVASSAAVPDVHVGDLVDIPDPRGHLRRLACTQ